MRVLFFTLLILYVLVIPVGFLFFGEIGAKRPIFPDRGESPLFSYESVFQTLRLFLRGGASPLSWLNISRVENLHSVGCVL